MSRDIYKNPYSADEQRVAQWFFEKGVGGGDDPIGALIASNEHLVSERDILSRKLSRLQKQLAEAKRGPSW